ncbi:hypothetical protein KUTeg_010273 [Tegillarca granosa]|uniref:Uncharacterized protein n=1 Tax=Tegillarca granosa TaxID=220873 RepID=A0ABQ9FB84_TEGGR|nr:hypothetical protein KUTeg_010273 [Tegillarca granosa]
MCCYLLHNIYITKYSCCIICIFYKYIIIISFVYHLLIYIIKFIKKHKIFYENEKNKKINAKKRKNDILNRMRRYALVLEKIKLKSNSFQQDALIYD